MHHFTYAVIIFIFLVSAVLSFVRCYERQQRRPPSRLPGPLQLPWIGRVHDLPISRMWMKFYEWSLEFGPIYATSMLGTEYVSCPRTFLILSLLMLG